MIEIEQLRKSYRGARALDGFELRVREGELFGLVGPNGAGKTTLMKILATLVRPDSGQARVGGFDVVGTPRSVKKIIGYMPDQPGLYQDMRVREYLEFFADAFRLENHQRTPAVDRALDRSHLAGRSQDFVEQLSFGMKQRLLLAKTLLHEPRVLLLDEPATGLDPMARIDLRVQLKQLNAEGVTILVSSHILSDLEDICDHVALIDGGRNAHDAAGHSVIEVPKAETRAFLYEVEILGDVNVAANPRLRS
jgi:ABC-2 type transport system ATP-binding protein